MAEKASLLLIDDDEYTLETLGDVLQEKGYRIETARNGEEAIMKAREHFFNVALIDVKLPDVTGIEVLRAFREQYPARMNIMITAHATLQNAVDALNLGANAYIMKPIDHKMLDQMIRRCLKKQREAPKITQENLAGFIDEVIEMRSKEQRLMQRYYQRL